MLLSLKKLEYKLKGKPTDISLHKLFEHKSTTLVAKPNGAKVHFKQWKEVTCKGRKEEIKQKVKK